MCGIVGYNGGRQAARILLKGLSKLEYRGYDSAGIAVRNGENEAKVIKAKGRLKILEEKTDHGDALKGCIGIGHTRWATHGEPSENNAHPHRSDDGFVIGVHNGIIENYQEIRSKLERHGYKFYSQTDTEAMIKLVDYYYKKYKIGYIDAIAKSMVRVRGSYALAILFADDPDHIWVARKDSPLVIGTNEDESFIASDVPAILEYTRSVYYIDNLEMACIGRGDVHFYNLDGEEISKEKTEITWDAEAAEKGGYEHFMMKEIYEQPKAVRDTINSLVVDGQVNFESVGLNDEIIKSITSITIVACGSAYHTGVVDQYVIEDLARIPVRVELASEFRYRNPIMDKTGLVIVVSQSGETADTLAALREAKANGIRTLAIVNVVGSSIAREADHVLYTLAGPEIAVATTKAYSTQLIAGYLLAIRFGQVRGTLTDEKAAELLEQLEAIPDKISKIFDDIERLQWFAGQFSNVQDVFFIGRGIDYAICMEGSLKLKEISYIHSEAYAAGELKHGTISLIEKGTMVIGVATQDDLYEKTKSNMVEVASRGAYLCGITEYGNFELETATDFTYYIPKTEEHFSASLAVIPLQIISYYVACNRGLDVDKPRNLAKSVTVE